VIVSCPSCQTRYHWRASGGGRAVCDRCEAQVPLVASRPTYVVRAQAVAVAVTAGGGGTHVAVGEPRSRAVHDAPRHEPVAAFPARVSSSPAVTDRGAKPAVPEVLRTVPLAPSGVGLARRPARAASTPADLEPRIAIEHRSRSGGRRLLQLFVTVLLGGVGAAGGHYAMMKGWIPPLQVHPAVLPVDPRLLGGLLGVLLAWPLIRWMSPRR